MIPTKSQYKYQENKVTESRYYLVNIISLFIYSLKELRHDLRSKTLFLFFMYKTVDLCMSND